MTKKNHGEIERLLAVAKQRVSGSLARLRDRHGEEERAAYRSANAELLALERQLAEARGEPYATPVDFPVEWDTGAPLPHLICSDDRTFLMFLVATDGGRSTSPERSVQSPRGG